MSEFVKPKQVFVSDKEYIERLINAQLRKDLYDNEEICANCHGTGIVTTNNIYGLSEDPDKRVMFPYEHQALSFCPYCYNGVVRRCKLCGGLIDKGYLKHNCREQFELDRKERKEKEDKALANAPLATPEMIEDSPGFYSDYYSDNEGYFLDFDEFFEDWFENHDEDEPRPEFVWLADSYGMSIDAANIIESATEDLYEDANLDVSDSAVKELQDYLDDWCKRCGVSETLIRTKYKVAIPWGKYNDV